MTDLNDLCDNAAKGSIEKCVQILKSGVCIGASDNLDWTPIMYAARNGHQNVVKHLYESGANILTPNKYGYTPLNLAVACENEETFNYILEATANNSKEKLEEGSTSFGLACFYGKTAIVKLYLTLNIFEINEPVLFGMTPLLLAVSNGKVETAKLLLSAGANKFVTNLRLQTCYDIAVYRRDTKMLALLSHNAFANSPLTPLTPLNNRMKFSPSVTLSAPFNTRKKLFGNKLDVYETEDFLSLCKNDDFLKSSQRENYRKKDSDDHSFCNCHYLNGLLSPRKLHFNDELNCKKRFMSMEKRKKLKYLTIPCIKKKRSNSPRKDRKQKSDENEFESRDCRMKQNLKITKLLTMLQLEEYISTFILQEIDADTISTLTEEDLGNMGIDKSKCDEVLEKISKFKF